MTNYKLLARCYFDASDDINAENIGRQLLVYKLPDGYMRWTSRNAVLIPTDSKPVSLDGISINIPPENFPKRPANHIPGQPGKYSMAFDFYVDAKDRNTAWHMGQRYLDMKLPGATVYGTSPEPAVHARQPVSLDGIRTDNIPPPIKAVANIDDKPKSEPNKNPLEEILGAVDEFGGRAIDY